MVRHVEIQANDVGVGAIAVKDVARIDALWYESLVCSDDAGVFIYHEPKISAVSPKAATARVFVVGGKP